ncbi:hypothetical protein ACOSQ3_029894 [Xanthoceras sorbifolium]
MEQIHAPHVVFLPFPAQGHIKPMMKLAKLLNHAKFQVTFVNTDHNHDRLMNTMSYTDLTSFYNRFPTFLFRSIPDGLQPDHPRSAVSKPAFRRLLMSSSSETGRWQPPTCIIADGIMSFVAIEVAEELGIPIITFRTYSATCSWTYFHLLKLIEEEQVPFPEDNLDKPITSVQGLENVLRRRDLPIICRVEEADDPVLQFFIGETYTMTRASALILDTFHEIEASMISRLNSIFTKVYAIGPLHALFKSRTKDLSESDNCSSNGIGLWREDKSCMTWLDSQPLRSVIYVSFGSLLSPSRDQMLEFWHGLVNSGKPFLWVIRPGGLIAGESGIDPKELEMGCMERGFIVSWAPQEEVLAHPAIGGFLTHSGWNSTLESIDAGVPMICWPQIADQRVNSRCVSEVWKIGYDMKDTCDRLTVEKLVRDLMDSRREEIMESTNRIARLARNSVKQGGSSYSNLEKLIEDIRKMSL